MLDPLHRILTGQTVTRGQLIAAGVIVLVWFAMDVHQYIGWLTEKGCR